MIGEKACGCASFCKIHRDAQVFVLFPCSKAPCQVPMDQVLSHNQGVYSHFCDTRESPALYGVLVFGKPFLLYHRSGFHFPQPCLAVFFPAGEAAVLGAQQRVELNGQRVAFWDVGDGEGPAARSGSEGPLSTQ